MTRAASEPLLQPGSTLAGKYRVDSVLGEGGMGVVLQAHHLQLDERVAIKVPRLEALTNPDAVGRFLREARAAVKIKSEHVARVNDVGTLETGQPYIVMEFLEGVDLASWLQSNGPLPVGQAVEFVLQACEALAEAHALGMVHRDLKPANLFCTQRRDGSYCIKVLDFGISKLGPAGSSLEASMTQAGSVMGSPLYMSPEQLQSARDVDARSDIWSMGVVLYELLTGNLPFEADTLMGLGVQIAQASPPPMRSVRDEVPAAVEHVVFHCLEKDRERRYSDIAQLAQALYEFAPARARASVERIALVIKGGAALAGTLAQQFAAQLLPDSIPSDQLPHAQTRQSEPRLDVVPSHLPPGGTEAVHPMQPAAPRQTAARTKMPGAGTTAANAPVSADSEPIQIASFRAEPPISRSGISKLMVAGLACASVLLAGGWLWFSSHLPAPDGKPTTGEILLAPAAAPAASGFVSPSGVVQALDRVPLPNSGPGALLATPALPSRIASAAANPKELRQSGSMAGKPTTVSPNTNRAQRQPAEPARTPRADCDPPYMVDEKGEKHFKAECF